MDKFRNCPMCKEVPEKEIYQCTEGHVICSSCISNVKRQNCPECRTPFVHGQIKIRNKALEEILDGQEFECKYNDQGCAKILKRGEITSHSNSCSYKPVLLCEIIGYNGCRFTIGKSVSRSQVISHFKDDHAVVLLPLLDGRQGQVQTKLQVNYLREQVSAEGGDFDFNLAFPKYTMDVIASCAFGVESKCFEVAPDKMSTFEDMGKRFQFNLNPVLFLKFILLNTLPKLADMLGIEVLDTVPQKYFSDVIKQVIKRRRQNGERANDFLQLMLDAQQGLLKVDDDSNEVLNGTTEKNVMGHLSAADIQKIRFNDEDVVANCVAFILGGFDSTLSLLLFAVYQLALEQEVQEKVYKNVKTNIDANDGALSYEGLLNMTYLDMFLNETLRFFPPTSKAERVCTKDYPVPGSNIVIRKGTIVGIPIHPIHRDPKYFDNPESFEPERFSVNRKSSRNNLAFMPFGHGPRNCIGMRFALIEVKTVIAKLVYTFKFDVCQKTTIPMEFDQNVNLKPIKGMWLHATPR